MIAQQVVPVSGSEMHLGSTITASAFSVFALQWLKKQKWFPVLKEDGTRVLNRIAAFVTSFCAAAGITYAFAPSLNGGHTLTINIPSLASVGVFLWAWAKQFCIQEWVYQSSANRKPLTP